MKIYLPNRQSLLCIVGKISLAWFLLVSVLKKRCELESSLSFTRQGDIQLNAHPSFIFHEELIQY